MINQYAFVFKFWGQLKVKSAILYMEVIVFDYFIFGESQNYTI